MARSPIDENSVHGIVLEGDPSGNALPWKGNDATGGAYVELISPTGDSLIDDVNDAVKVSIVAGDIQIGAVEIKNSTDDTRATVDSDGLNVNVKKAVISSGITTWVTTAVTLTTLSTAYLLPTTEQTGRKVIIIYNVSDTAVYIGTSSVTTTTGILLPAGGTMTLDSESGIYGICGTSGKIVNTLEGK